MAKNEIKAGELVSLSAGVLKCRFVPVIVITLLCQLSSVVLGYMDVSPFISGLLAYGLNLIGIGAITVAVLRDDTDGSTSPAACVSVAADNIVGLTVAASIELVAIGGLGYALLYATATLVPGMSIVAWPVTLIVCVIAWARLCLATPAVVSENLGGLGGIKRSLELTGSGRWNQVGGALVTVALLGVLLMGLVEIVFAVKMTSLDPGLAQVLSTSIQILFSALGGVAVGVSYREVRANLENTDSKEMAKVFG